MKNAEARRGATGASIRGTGWMSIALVVGLIAPQSVEAGEADVMAVRTLCTPDRVCGFTVTVKHADTGWNHYADRFEIVAPDGRVLATRVLEHPHVHEQPFTRTLGGVEVPAGIERVTLRAHDSVHESGGREVEVAIEIIDEAAPAPVDD
jgi:hypothetical protein